MVARCDYKCEASRAAHYSVYQQYLFALFLCGHRMTGSSGSNEATVPGCVRDRASSLVLADHHGYDPCVAWGERDAAHGIRINSRQGTTRAHGTGLPPIRGRCEKQFNERSTGLLSRTQCPRGVIALVVLCRLRYKVSLRALAEMFLIRGFVFNCEADRDWEAKLMPTLADELRRTVAGIFLHHAGRPRRSYNKSGTGLLLPGIESVGAGWAIT
jgi:hypothetical protein